MKKVIFSLFIITAFLYSQNSHARIVVDIATGLKPGVTYGSGVKSFSGCSPDGSNALGECWEDASWPFSSTCPSWASLHALCPNAKIININVDDQIADFIDEIYIEYIDNGTTSGNQSKTFYNVDTGEVWEITIAWKPIPEDGSSGITGTRFTIDDEMV